MGRAISSLARALAILVVVLATPQPTSVAALGSAPKTVKDHSLHVVYESAVYNQSTGEVNFTVRFNRRPDLRKVDEFGRKADSFQYFIVGDASLRYPLNFDAVIRGDEAQQRPRLLPIRSSAPSDENPAAGGWGAVRATTPFTLHGRVLTFSVALKDLSDHSTDGRFGYTLQTYSDFGSLVDSIDNQSIVRSRHAAT